MSWNFEETSKQGGKSTNKVEFARLPEGITKIRVMDNVPFFRWAHWMPQFSRKVTCPGQGCPICAVNKEMRDEGKDNKYGNTRNWSLNIFNHNTGKHEILEQGITFMEELRVAMEELKEDGKELTDAVLKVRNRMSAGRSTWRIDIESDNAPLTDEEKEALPNLLDKNEYFKAPTIEQINELLALPNPSTEEYIRVMFGERKLQSESEEIGEELEIETE